ncbi:hypothetical protein EK21DRAFT_119543 [Setomelanomma holmii]|uniref:Uncharacterized protein n=1 Tax=Setomelanomma holmii TaxID=210430 RepID=A0A9P4GW82_9PLEO|nr:hypothetical protein EK21DRAFT_119543 [Setomelanomma holmii]
MSASWRIPGIDLSDMSAGLAGTTGHGPLSLAHQRGTPKPAGQSSDEHRINTHQLSTSSRTPLNLTIKSLTASPEQIQTTNQTKMSTQPHRDSTILLRDQYEWTTWINQIQARAAVYNIWNNLNLEHPVPFLVEPTLPEAPEPSGYHAPAGVQEASRPSELSAQG